MADVFVGLGQRYVNRPALISGARSLTFSELAAYCAQVGHALAARGIAPGTNVGLALRDGYDMTVYTIALWMIDAVPVPLDFRTRTDERLRLVEDFDLVLLVTDSAAPGAPYEAQALDSQWLETIARQSTVPPRDREPTTRTAMISLTSGTTGRPLGLVITHTTLLLRQYQQRSAGLSFPDGLFFNAAPHSFNAARMQTYQRLVEGNGVQFFPSMFSPEEFVEALNRAQATYAFLVPTVVRSLIQYAREQRSAPLLPTLRGMQTGGSASTAEEKRDAKTLLTPGYFEIYASTLAGTLSLLRGDDIDTHPDTVGRCVPTARIEIVDDHDRPLPLGETGIIRVRSPGMVTETYRNATRPTGDRIKNGWVYPGDLGALDSDGFLRILGRSSDVIIRGGGNVHPSEIEAVMARHPAIKEIYAVGYPAEREGEEIGAVLVASAPVTEADLVAFSRTQLPPDKRPRRFIIVDAPPLSSVGKPDRKAMQKLFEQ